jgi:hypothetical protein
MNFNEALVEATRLAKARLADLQEHVFLVRDLHGRIRVLLKTKRGPGSPFFPPIQGLVADLAAALGPYAYAADDLVMYRDQLKSVHVPDDIGSTTLDEAGGFKVCLHDRLLTGTEWNARPAAEVNNPKRFTLFSMKGGVGRSTTATVLARHLAQKGKRVLVFDLDLESPGVGTTLLGPTLPRFGIVDWFVEDVLGAGATILPNMLAESALGTSATGRIAVVPAFGIDTGDYLAKLGRAYLERGPSGYEPWPERLKGMVSELEAQERPDIVLLDSRTGLHDTSAALVLAMGANTLMFAVDSDQTWAAYRFLFEHWKAHPNRPAFRDKLWVLGSMVPDTETATYLEGLRDRAWELFQDTLYDAVDAIPNPGAFAFPSTDEAGNHFPRPIHWQRGLMAFDQSTPLTDQLVVAAYQSFLDWFDKVLLGEGGTP